jgi:APA family basic amino acid/polyamine antiporter
MVAWGWSGYLNSLLANFGLRLPPWLAGTRFDEFVYYNGSWQHLDRVRLTLQAAGIDPRSLPHAHGAFNILGALIILIISLILIKGITESARFTTSIVFVKIFVLLFFVAVGAHYLLRHPALAAGNWHPFIPASTGLGQFGWSGMGRAAAILFFAYVGFDAVSTAGQEARNPQKDMPIGMFGSLGICTALYLLFAGVLVGLVNYKDLNVADPLAVGINVTGLHWGTLLVTLGALGSLGSTILVLLLGLSRILYALSRDGLLPKAFSSIQPRFKTPYVSSALSGGVIALLAGLLPIDFLAQMVSIGTLMAFATVCIAVWILRSRHPDLPRPFKIPWMPVVSSAGLMGSLGMMLCLNSITWIRLIGWLVIGLAIYFVYGRSHSLVQRKEIEVFAEVPIELPRKEQTPERELVVRMGKGAFRVFVIILGVAAILGSLSIFFPTIDQKFQVLAPIVSLIAIFVGLSDSILPELKSLWRLRKQQSLPDEETDSSVRELVESLGNDLDDSKTKI